MMIEEERLEVILAWRSQGNRRQMKLSKALKREKQEEKKKKREEKEKRRERKTRLEGKWPAIYA